MSDTCQRACSARYAHVRVFLVVRAQELVVDENALKQIHLARGLVHHDLRQLLFVARVRLHIAQVVEHHAIAARGERGAHSICGHLPLVAAQLFHWRAELFVREPRRGLTVLHVTHFTVALRESA